MEDKYIIGIITLLAIFLIFSSSSNNNSFGQSIVNEEFINLDCFTISQCKEYVHEEYEMPYDVIDVGIEAEKIYCENTGCYMIVQIYSEASE